MKEKIINLFNERREELVSKIGKTYAYLVSKKAFEVEATEVGFIKCVMSELVSDAGQRDFCEAYCQNEEKALNEAISFAEDRVIAATCPKHLKKAYAQADSTMDRIDAKHNAQNSWKRSKSFR